MKLRYGTPEEAGMDPRRIAHIKDLARGWVEAGITPSLVVLAARRGVIVLHEAYGVMGPEPDAGPLQKDSIFPLASLTKPITATAAMCLVEDGLLGLNRPVQWYLPEFVGDGKDAVMVHHLLTHTSGLVEVDVEAYVTGQGPIEIPPAGPAQNPIIHDYLMRRYDAPLSRPPGQEMAYYNANYEFLGEIVRRVSGRSLSDHARQRIFEPLGMLDTWYSLPDAVSPRLVRRAGHEPGADLFEQFKMAETPIACGGACSTALDMAVFGQTFLNGGSYGEARVLSPASVAAMTRNQTPGIGWRSKAKFFPESSWGLGWNVRGSKLRLTENEPLLSPQAFDHGGLGGVCLWVDPVHQTLALYFSVCSQGGVPSGFEVAEKGLFGIQWRADLFIDSVMASVAD